MGHLKVKRYRPRVLTCQTRRDCARCGGRIALGDRMRFERPGGAYSTGSRTTHVDCPGGEGAKRD